MTWNTADRSITTCGSTVSIAKNTGASTNSFDITNALRDDDDKIVTILVYQTAAGGGNFSNPSVSVTYTTSATANYTILYVAEIDGVETQLKSSRIETGIVGESTAISESDKTSITYNGWKYLYDSDNASETTIANDGSSTVKVVFHAAAKKNYTITSSYNGNALAWTSSGFIWEDETSATIFFPFYQLYDDNKLVTRDRVSNELKYTATIENDGDVVDIEYADAGIDNIYLLSEAEDLGTDLTESATSFTNRISNHKIVYGASGTLLSLPAGKYIVTLCVAGKPNNGNTTYQAYAGNQKIITDYNSTGNVINNAVSVEFTIYGTTPITFTCEGSSSDRGIDIVYVQKTGDVELPANVTVNVTAAGYATYCSQYDLDLSSVESAYTATLDGTNISFTKQTGKVAAGTGLLIKAAEGTVNIPVVATGASAVADNALIGVLASTAVPAGSFVLMGSPTVGFYKANNEFTVGANTAYIAALPEASRTFIALDGDATGIKAINAAEVAEGIYNLQGQRVAKAQKGLYIVNGKKAIVK